MVEPLVDVVPRRVELDGGPLGAHALQVDEPARLAAIVNAFDRFAAGGAPANIVILSLSNLRGVSSEAVNAGGRVTVNLATGSVTSVARLLPADGSFDLWLIDNQSGPGHTTLADSSDLLMRVGTYTVVSATARVVSATMGPTAFTNFYPDRAFVVRSGPTFVPWP